MVNRDLSAMLRAAGEGQPIDVDALLPLVYEELRCMARGQLREERRGHTLQPTALVHEAYLKLVGGQRLSWNSKRQFYGAAAEAMRRILVDYARARVTQKRGGGRAREAVSLAELIAEGNPQELLAVDEAVSRLSQVEPRAGSIAQLRLFAGLSVADTASALDAPLRTVERDWAFARAWLYEKLK